MAVRVLGFQATEVGVRLAPPDSGCTIRSAVDRTLETSVVKVNDRALWKS